MSTHMSTPTETPRPAASPLNRFLGGSPIAVLARLVLLSILVGVIMSALGLDPLNVIESLQRFAFHVWDMGFDAMRWLWGYLLLGAVIVVPIWLIVRLVRAPVGR
jgi:hypothetical protein